MREILSIPEFEATLPTGVVKKFNTKALLTHLNDFVPQGGFVPSVMKVRLVIQKKIEAMTDKIMLEEAEWEMLKAIAPDMPWAIKHENVLQLTTNILEAKEVT